MRVLVTSDDGADEAGTLQLAEAAAEVASEVILCAPVPPCLGGIGTSTQPSGDLVVYRWPDGERRIYPTLGTPALSVVFGCSPLAESIPDVVAAGINYGPNVGRVTLHSGTVGGAVLTALSLGKPALGLNIDDTYSTDREDWPPHWDTAALLAKVMLPWLLRRPEAVGINVNIPNVPRPEIRGLRATEIATTGEIFELTDPHPVSGAHYRLGYDTSVVAADTDVGVLSQGCITVVSVGGDRAVAEEAAEHARRQTGLTRDDGASS
ncbi:MAG: 5'/3'-nucleotidase SurE [Actinomycetota bacterium]|nr:5'/3'-nucleotidase SurE [Actinomycetota bacterium]